MVQLPLLLAIGLLLLALYAREHFTDPEFRVTRPERNAEWLSKIDAEAPIGGNDDSYIKVLQQFYDTIYVPAATKPKDTDVEVFVNKITDPDIDKPSLRKIIASGFKVQLTETASAREQRQLVKTGALVGFTGSNLQPKDGVNEVYRRKEDPYKPADTRRGGELPEGLYAPVEQQETPRREGIWKPDALSTSWNSLLPYSVCTDETAECAKNVL
jgi:hypothetical protein